MTTPQSLALSWSPLCWFHQVQHRGCLQLQILSISESQVCSTIKTTIKSHVLGFNSYLKKLKRDIQNLFLSEKNHCLLHTCINMNWLSKNIPFLKFDKADLRAIHILCWELSQHLTNWAVFFYKVGIEADVKRRLINIGDIDDKHLGDPESWSTMSIVYTFNLLKIKVPSKQLKSWGLIMGSEVLILYTGIYFWQKYSHFQYLLLPIIIASDKSAEHVFNQLSMTYTSNWNW